MWTDCVTVFGISAKHQEWKSFHRGVGSPTASTEQYIYVSTKKDAPALVVGQADGMIVLEVTERNVKIIRRPLQNAKCTYRSEASMWVSKDPFEFRAASCPGYGKGVCNHDDRFKFKASPNKGKYAHGYDDPADLLCCTAVRKWSCVSATIAKFFMA